MTPSIKAPPDRVVDRFAKDRIAFLLLVAVFVVVRVPFLRAFDLVDYDGTYYINQAKSMLGMSSSGGAFPIGYPACIAIFLPFVRDGVRAAQAASLLAGIGSVWLLFILGRRIVSKPLALFAASIFAVNPLFVRLSLSTLSESVFLFWLLLGFYLFKRGKRLAFGVTMGVAAVTRPEAVGVFAVLLLWRRWSWKNLAAPAVGFALLHVANAAVLSITTDRLVLLPKSEFFGTSAAQWQAREAWIDFAGRDDYERSLEGRGGRSGLEDGIRRFPRELGLLARHAAFIALLLALYGMLRRRLFVLAGLVPFFFYPFFTIRSEPRYVLPYVPFVLLYAVVGLDTLRARGWRSAAAWLLAASTAAGLVVNRAQLTAPVSDGYQWAKKTGTEWRARLAKDDRVADRKPFFAFYAGAVYRTIPIAPYDDVMGYLVEDDVRLLVLHKPTIQTLRPALLPLLEDRALIRGELRFRQVQADPGVYALYESTGSPDPLGRRRLTPKGAGLVVTPSWSPDGNWIAYRVTGPADAAGLYIAPAGGGEIRRVLPEAGINDPVSWSPDSKCIALAVPSEPGAADIAIVDLEGSEVRRLTTSDAVDRSPSWSGSGGEIAFCSNRTGRDEIWIVDTATGAEQRITEDGGNTYPALSPGGDRIAYVNERGGLVVLDRTSGRRAKADLPREAKYAPSWSPDGRFIATTAGGGEGVQVFIVTSDGAAALTLTKSTAGNGMPCWSPDGGRMVVVTNDEGDYGLWVLSGIEPYLDRLTSPYEILTIGADE